MSTKLFLLHAEKEEVKQTTSKVKHVIVESVMIIKSLDLWKKEGNSLAVVTKEMVSLRNLKFMGIMNDPINLIDMIKSKAFKVKNFDVIIVPNTNELFPETKSLYSSFVWKPPIG